MLRRAEAVIARELKEETLTEEQRAELRALKQRAKSLGDEPSSTYVAKIALDSLRALVTAVWAYRICDRLAIVARIAAGMGPLRVVFLQFLVWALGCCAG